MSYFNNNTPTAAETAAATLALVDIMPTAAVQYLIEWWGELFDGLTAQKVEEFVTYETVEEYPTVDDLADAYGYEDREDMEESGGYLIVEDAAFDGYIVIM